MFNDKKVSDILQKRRNSILFYMYILCFLIFSVINLKNIYFDNKIEIIILGIISLILLITSYLFLYKNKKYQLSTYSILFILGYTIILAIIFNDFENFMPAYIITFYIYAIISVNLKKGMLINTIFSLVFLLVSFLSKDYLLDSQFLNNKMAIMNFILVGAIILSFIVFYEYTRINTYKMLLNSNHEKDLLYKEVHHRVKNNLNMISSMMSMQFEGEDKKTQQMVDATKERINSIAMVHTMLYITENIEKVSAHEFIKNLTNSILRSTTKPIELNLKLEKLELSLNEIIPIGLITNELTTNSIKHAFEKTSQAKITIVLKRHKDNVIFTYMDNGSGYKENFKENLGLMLVEMNTKQLKGTLKVKNKHGLSYKLKYKKRLHV